MTPEDRKTIEDILQAAKGASGRGTLIAHIDRALALLRAEPVDECEAMCGDHGGIEGCSCSECSTPLGPRELCAYCNGCGLRVKWPMADGTEYRAPVKAREPKVMSNEEIEEALEYGKQARPRSPLFDRALELLRAEPEASEPNVMTDDHYNILKERMIEEHRKYGDKLRFGHWAEIASRKVVSHLRDMGFLAPLDRSRMEEGLVMEVIRAGDHMDRVLNESPTGLKEIEASAIWARVSKDLLSVLAKK